MSELKIGMNGLQKIILLVGGSLFALFFVIFGIASMTTIEPGEVGLVVKQFGDNRGVQETTLNTGTQFINPFTNDVIIYDTRLRQYDMEDVPSGTQDGQPVQLDVSFEIGLIDNLVPLLHERVGQNYFDQVIMPASRAAIRTATANKMSDQIYTGKGRSAIQEELNNSLTAKLEPLGITITSNLRDIEFLNADFVAVLEEKAKAAQEETIQERKAAGARQEALKIKAIAEGQKFKTVQEAEAKREQLKLQGEGYRLQKEEEAKGILAVATAEAEGINLKQRALSGPGGQLLRDIEVLGGLGKTVEFYGVPTGAPGTNTYIVDEALRGKIAIGGGQ